MRAGVLPWGFVGTGQGLMVVEGEVGMSRSTLVEIQSPAAVGKEG